MHTPPPKKKKKKENIEISYWEIKLLILFVPMLRFTSMISIVLVNLLQSESNFKQKLRLVVTE